MAERTQIAEPRVGADRQFELPCDCVSRCNVLFIAEWQEEEGVEGWQSFDFYVSYREDTWRRRIKAAWLSLRGKGAWYHSVCSTPEQGRELGKWLLGWDAAGKVRYVPVADELHAVLSSDWSEPLELKVEAGELLFRSMQDGGRR